MRESWATPRWRPNSGETVTQREQVPNVNKSQRSKRLIGKHNVLPAVKSQRHWPPAGEQQPSPHLPRCHPSTLTFEERERKKTHLMLIHGMLWQFFRQIPSRLCGPDLYQNTGCFITSLRPPLGICVDMECLL